MPKSSRISRSAFFPFWRGTDRPHVMCFHSSFVDAASQSSRTRFCQGSGVSPKFAANSPAMSPKVFARRLAATRTRGV